MNCDGFLPAEGLCEDSTGDRDILEVPGTNSPEVGIALSSVVLKPLRGVCHVQEAKPEAAQERVGCVLSTE
ncbi:hypothetical protein AGIG_G8871 [Arapaima gigas]